MNFHNNDLKSSSFPICPTLEHRIILNNFKGITGDRIFLILIYLEGESIHRERSSPWKKSIGGGPSLVFLLWRGILQDLDSILHAPDKVLHFNLKGSQALGSFGQNFLHFSFPIKNRLDFLLSHLLFYFFPHPLQPCCLICLWFHPFISFLRKTKNRIFDS